MNTYLKKIIYVFVLIPYLNSYSQSKAVSRSSSEGGSVVIAWAPKPGVGGYMLFRKDAGSTTYSTTPLNSSLIVPLSNCAVIRGTLLNPDSTNWKLLSQGLADTAALFNPCNVSSLSTTSETYTRLLYLAAFNLTIAKIAGLAFEDGTVTVGKDYHYRIVGVRTDGSEVEIATNLFVKAGEVTLPAAPSGLMAEAGDQEIQITWNINTPNAAGYRVLRSLSPTGTYQIINSTDFSFLITNKLNGDTLNPNKHGYNDFQTWDDQGNISVRNVRGSLITGPRNGSAYYYKVQSVDILGRPGATSAYVSATSKDRTLPSQPDDISVIPDESTSNGSVEVRWRHVTRDVHGHIEDPGVVKYEVYRFERSLNPDSIPNVLVATVLTSYSTSATLSKSVVDNSIGLRPNYGDKTWWYRIKAVDEAGNKSAWTAAVAAIIKDITAPAIPTGVIARGTDKQIDVSWSANTEPDIQEYQVYRSYCHYGAWVPCPDAKKDVDPKCEPCNEKEDKFKSKMGKDVFSPCSGPFVFLGVISKDSLLRAIAASKPAFVDRSITAGSPLCYAYWIKAVDHSGNKSGTFPFPSIDEQTQIVCERLRDKTAPQAAIISGLVSRDHAISVSWIAPPMQDTRAYHVYRAREISPQTEPPLVEFKWVGGLTVEPPPQLPMELVSPYSAPSTTTCGIIPVQISEQMSSGTIVDRTTNAHTVYWYKVTGIDFDGNEADLRTAVSVSTFTFETRKQLAPRVESLRVQEIPVG